MREFFEDGKGVLSMMRLIVFISAAGGLLCIILGLVIPWLDATVRSTAIWAGAGLMVGGEGFKWAQKKAENGV